MRVSAQVSEFLTADGDELGDIEVSIEVPGVTSVLDVNDIVLNTLNQLIGSAERGARAWKDDQERRAHEFNAKLGAVRQAHEKSDTVQRATMPDNEAVTLAEHYLSAPKDSAGPVTIKHGGPAEPFDPRALLISDLHEQPGQQFKVVIAWKHGDSLPAPDPGNMSAESYAKLLLKYAVERGVNPGHWATVKDWTKWIDLAEQTIATFGKALERNTRVL